MKRSTYIYRTIAATLLLMAISETSAQIDKEVEVIQAYIPRTQQATKPTLYPNMEDDAYIDPDIDYSITPISIHTPMESEPYAPAQINYSEFRSSRDYYVKAGVGYPLRSVADLYASRSTSTRGYMVGYVNHSGNYMNIENDYGQSNSSGQQHLTTGGAAGLYLGRRTAEVSVKYDMDRWSRYATSGSADEFPLYQRVGAVANFGDSFTDMNRWNLLLSAGADQMWSHSGYNNTSLEAEVAFGRNLFGGELRFGALIGSILGSSEYSNTTIGGEASYCIEGQSLQIKLGVEYYNDGVSSVGVERNTRNYFLPQVEINYTLSPQRSIVFFRSGGDIEHNDFASLAASNPYIEAGSFEDRSGLAIDFELGFKGASREHKFNYSLSAIVETSDSARYWIYEEEETSTTESNNGYGLVLGELWSVGANLSLNYRPNSKLYIGLEGDFRHYNEDDHIDWRYGAPTSRVLLEGRYRIGDFTIGAGCRFESIREVSQISTSLEGVEDISTIELPMVWDLGLDLSYRLHSGCIIFCEATNLLGAKLYDWARYREYGAGAIVGVKYNF